MSCAPARRRHGRRLASAIAVAVASSRVAAQPAQQPSLLQLEYGDSIGLPLSDAALEVFAFLEGGIVREWAAVDAASLPAGTNLLRVSRRTSEIEALEIFPRGSSVPVGCRPTESEYGVLVVWFRNP